MSGFLDSIKQAWDSTVKSAVQSAQDTQSVGAKDTSDPMQLDGVYKISPTDWYSAKPYGFIFNSRTGKQFTMFLPINPSNLTITTNFATNIIPTLYGTVEEHSEVRYYDISIEGTTGIAPKFIDPIQSNKADANTLISTLRSPGRASFPISDGVSAAAGGFFSKTLETISRAANKAVDFNLTKQPLKSFNNESSGYVAFHNLYRFLMKYKKDAAGIENKKAMHKPPLVFFNYKDGNKYSVVVRNFTLRRSADNPMLYYYSIQMRGYHLQSMEGSVENTLGERLKDLGLDGVKGSSMLGEIKDKASSVKSIINAAFGGIDILGR